MLTQIFETIMIVLLLIVGVLFAIVTYGMSESKNDFLEMEEEIEVRQLEDNFKN